MKAIKRTVSVLLSLMLVLGMVTMGISVASAAENTITYTSNIGAQGTKTYVPGTDKQVTVTYNLKTSTRIINAQAVVTFDPAVLKLADGQTAATVCPNIPGATVNLTKSGRVPFAASDFAGGYDFSAGGAFVTVIFDIIGSGNTTVNLAVDTLTGTTALNTSSANDVPVVIAEELQEGAAITPTAEAVVSGESGVSMDTFIYSRGVNLKGKIGFQFIFYANPEGYDASTLNVSIQGPHDDQNINKAYSQMQSAGKMGGKPVRTAAYFLMASYLTQPVTITVSQGSEVIATETLNVCDFASATIEANPNDNKVPLLKAMLNYGAYSQIYTNKFTDNLANKHIDSTLAPVTADMIQATPNSPATHPDVSALGLSLYQEGVELGSQNAINYYYRVDDETKFGSASATIDSKAATFNYVTKMGKKRLMLLKVADIAAKDMDSVHTIAFSNGKTYNVSILSYLKTKLASDSSDICTAMYWYYAAAKEYFS